MLTWLLAMLLGALWAPTFTYRVLEVPGGWETFPSDINNNGHISGFYSVQTQVATLHGFVYDGENYTTIDYPGAFNTRIHALNDHGDVCGDYTLVPGATAPRHAFVRNANGSIRDVLIPGASETRCEGLNNRGDIFGVYILPSTERDSFILSTSGALVLSNVPGATSPTEPREINDLGQGVGYYLSGEVLGFVRMADGFLTLKHPSTAGVTQALGISDDGLVAGRWNDFTKNLGFLWYRGQFIYNDITVPTAQGLTFPFGVNKWGEVTGYYMGTNASGQGGTFGFVAVPSTIFNPRVDRFSNLQRLVKPRTPLPIHADLASPMFRVEL